MNTKPKPIKRHESIKQFSREHHFGLLLCWKIRTGLKKEISLERIKNYTDWFFENQLKPHFLAEEKYIFSILPEDHKLIKRALSEHRKLERLFNDDKDIYKSLNQIEEKLDEHIRFEERILFNEIQEVATEAQLQKIAEIHTELPKDEWKDAFWEKNVL